MKIGDFVLIKQSTLDNPNFNWLKLHTDNQTYHEIVKVDNYIELKGIPGRWRDWSLEDNRLLGSFVLFNVKNFLLSKMTMMMSK